MKVTMKVRLTFFEELLGTASADPEIHAEYIASKASDAPSKQEEIDAIGVAEAIEKAMTIFPKLEDGTPFLYDYQAKGFFKDACKSMQNVKESFSARIPSYRSKLDICMFILERKIPIHFSGKIHTCQRPLRAQTAQGERIALANSEAIPAGAWIEFTLMSITDENKSKTKGNVKYLDLFRELLDYGELRGIGQWRNSGKGRFYWGELDENGNVIGGNKPKDC